LFLCKIIYLVKIIFVLFATNFAQHRGQVTDHKKTILLQRIKLSCSKLILLVFDGQKVEHFPLHSRLATENNHLKDSGHAWLWLSHIALQGEVLT